MHDDRTEELRRQMVAETNSDQRTRDELAAVYGQTWDTDELRRDFEVTAFLAPFVLVRRKSDGVEGTLQFRHHPRIYFGFRT